MIPILRSAPVACLCAVLLAACSTARPGGDLASKQPALAVAGVVIRNDLPYPVTDVMIEVPATGAFAGCGNLPPRTQCSNRFEEADYRYTTVLIRWREHGEPRQTGEFVIEAPPDPGVGQAYAIEVIVFAPGEAGARLVPMTAAGLNPR